MWCLFMSGLAGRVIAHNHEDNTSSYPRAEDSGLPVGTGWEGNTACVSIHSAQSMSFMINGSFVSRSKLLFSACMSGYQL